MKTSPHGHALLAQREGVRLHAYRAETISELGTVTLINDYQSIILYPLSSGGYVVDN